MLYLSEEQKWEENLFIFFNTQILLFGTCFFDSSYFGYFEMKVGIPGGRSWPLKDICQRAYRTLQMSNRTEKSFHHLHSAHPSSHEVIQQQSAVEEMWAKQFSLNVHQHTVPGRDVDWIILCKSEFKIKEFLYNLCLFHNFPTLKTFFRAVLLCSGVAYVNLALPLS